MLLLNLHPANRSDFFNTHSKNTQVLSPKQPRTYTYDLLGRVLSETNPEWAPGNSTPLTANYTYDSVSRTALR